LAEEENFPGLATINRELIARAKTIGSKQRVGLPRRIEKWSLTSMQQRLVETGGRLFAAMLRRIAALPLPSG